MIDFPSQIPDNSGPFERVISQANRDARGLADADRARIRTLWDPWTCPESELELLAWAWSVDIWSPRWPVERRRKVVGESRAFHERKTTVAGYRMALGYVDAELVRAHLPRHGFVVARATSAAEHEAWLASLPEIRIYDNVPRTKASRPGFVVGRRGIGSAEAAVLDRRRAVLIRGGVETALVFAGVRIDAQGRLLTEAERLVIPEPVRAGFRVGGPYARPLRTNLSGAQRIIALSLSDRHDAFIRNAITPSLTAIDVTPRRMYGPVPGGLALAVDRCALRARPIRANRADEQLYLSIRLADGTAPATAGNGRGSALGRSRLQRKPYTASLLVHAPMPLRAGFPASGRVVRAGPDARVAEVAHALDVSAALRDTLYLDINSTRPITFADLERLPAGTRFGDAVRL